MGLRKSWTMVEIIRPMVESRSDSRRSSSSWRLRRVAAAWPARMERSPSVSRERSGPPSRKIQPSRAAAEGDGHGARAFGEGGRQPDRALATPPAQLGFDRLARLDRERRRGRGRPPRPIARADLRDGLGLSRPREGAGGIRDQAQNAFRMQRLREAQADLVQALQVAAPPLQAAVLAADAVDHLVEASGELLDLVAAADLERRVQVAFGGADGPRHELGQRPGDAAGQHEGAEHAQRDRGQADAGQGQSRLADLGLHLLRREHGLARDEPAQALLDEHDREGHHAHDQRRKVQQETGLQPDAGRQASGARTAAVVGRQGQERPSIIPANVRHPGR